MSLDNTRSILLVVLATGIAGAGILVPDLGLAVAVIVLGVLTAGLLFDRYLPVRDEKSHWTQWR